MQIYKTFINRSAITDSDGNKGAGHRRNCNMYNAIICAIVAVMLASIVVAAKPLNNQINDQTRAQQCRQMVGVEKGEGEAGKSATMRSQIMRWDDCMMGREQPR
jgi:hypothetical protein